MNIDQLLGRLLGYDDVASIESVRPSFAAPWAHDGPAWVIFACLGLSALAAAFYLRGQQRGRRRTRVVLAVLRAGLLCFLLLILADPILELTFTSHPRPLLWVLVDGTDSMGIADELSDDQSETLAAAVDLAGYARRGPGLGRPERMDFFRALVEKDEGALLRALNEKFRLRLYLFDSAEGVRALELPDLAAAAPDLEALSAQLTTEGAVTALGNAFAELGRRHAVDNLAALLVVSDFDQNAGAAPLAPAARLGVPVFTLGVGPRTAVDLRVDLTAPPTMKMAETSTLSVTLRQRELEGEEVAVRVTAQGPDDEPVLVGERQATLTGGGVFLEFPFTPNATGRFLFVADVEPLAGETVVQNNRSEREVRIIDDFLRLLFVEYEPTWEWRFVKEVFHRDKLVGLRGFRTYLRSADPLVRETNEFFLPSLTLPRSEFFRYDVIFLGDMPAATLSTRFCEMTREFVSQFGGGLVVLGGPRFGPGQLAETPLADMLPVVVDPDARLRDDREFSLQLTPLAAQFDFMRLGTNATENAKAWKNLARLHWFQPVQRVEPRGSTVLAEHPTETCIDGETPQPLIAVRKYGRGEVVYLAFNEMWRLRRLYGERYYRQFWGQLIHRLGLSHALGSHKRFVVRTDRGQYRAGEKALVTVEAYDRDFHPLSEGELPGKRLEGKLLRPNRAAGSSENRTDVALAQLRPGVFETQLPVYEGGEYRVRVDDPLADEAAEVVFSVTDVSAERRSAVRNAALQANVAVETGGKAYELTDVGRLVEEFDPPPLTETTVEIFPLWSTWFCFVLVVLLMFSEWAGRKLVNLA